MRPIHVSTAQTTAAVYVRVSTEEQALGGVSLDMQERVCRAEAKRLGHRAVLYRDEGYTATHTRRPALQQLLLELATHECIIIWKFDRLCRNPRDWEQLLAALEESDTGLVSASEHADLSTPWGRAMLRIMAVFAGLFVEQLRENVAGAMEQVAQEGRKPGGDIYGYVSREGCLVIDPTEAAIVRELYERVGAGESYRGIAESLNARGVVGKRGGTMWRAARIREIVRNPVYIGQFRWKGAVRLGAHEAIVDGPTWERAQAVVSQRAYHRGAGRRHYTPLFRCGHCGGPIGAHHARIKAAGGATRQLAQLRCRDDLYLPVAQRHPRIVVAQQKAMAVVWRQTRLLLDGSDFAAAVSAVRLNDEGDARGDLHTRLAQLDHQRMVNLQAARQGSITLDELQRENAPLMTERDRLLREVETAPRSGIWDDLARLSGEGLIASAQELPVEQQVTFLGSLYDRIDLFGDHLVFRYPADALPACERPLPGYYSPRRGLTALGF